MATYSTVRWVGKVDTLPGRRMRHKNTTRWMRPIRMKRFPIPWSMVADVVMAFASFGLLFATIIMLMILV